MFIKQLDRCLFELYASRLIRRQLFSQLCNIDDPTLLDEIKLVEQSERNVRINLSRLDASSIDNIAGFIQIWMGVLIRRQIDKIDIDEDEKSTALSQLAKLDFIEMVWDVLSPIPISTRTRQLLRIEAIIQ